MSTSFQRFQERAEARAWRERMARIMEGVARDVEAAFPGTPVVWRAPVCLTGASRCGQPDCTICGRP